MCHLKLENKVCEVYEIHSSWDVDPFGLKQVITVACVCAR